MTGRLSEAEFRRFQSLIYERAGIHLSHNKRAMLAGRLLRRLRALQLDKFGQYFERVTESDEELTRMLDCVTTNETRFFRERKQFDFLEGVLIPEWKAEADAGRRPRVIRVWSAGCSTGEEPYSLAMTLVDGLGSQWDISVLATDLSTRVLDLARAGLWKLEKSADIPEPLLRQYMLRGRGSMIGMMKAGPEIRSVITFAPLNLHASDYGIAGRFDMVLCRNVLIYFDAESRRGAIDRLIDHLAPGGHFFIGHAETLHGITTRVRPVMPTVYRLEQGR